MSPVPSTSMSFLRSSGACAPRSLRASRPSLRPLRARASSTTAPSRSATAAATLLLALATGARAQATAPDGAVPAAPEPPVQQVAVTATRLPLRIDETVAEVTVLTREDLAHATGRTLSEVLATQPGVQVSGNGGGLGHYTSVFLRGMEARHTLLLVDGVRVDSATLGLPSFDNLPVALIDRIEIVRGPMSSIHGADAAGGVVQVFTRRGGRGAEGHGSVEAGSLGHRALQLGGSWGGSGLDLAVDASHVQTDGFSVTNDHVTFDRHDPDRDGFDQQAGSVRLGWALADGWRLEGLVLASSGLMRYDDAAPVDGVGDDARARLRNNVLALTLAGRVMPGWRMRLQAARSQDDYDTLAAAFADSLGVITTREKRFTWENAVDTPLGTVLGIVERTAQDVSKPGEPYPVAHRDIDGLGLALDGHAGAHTWQASVRRDRNSQFGRQTTGGLAYAFAVVSGWQAGASYGTSFVAPSFNQLYYPQFGNPDLQPERGHATELFVRWTGEAQSVRAAAWRQRVRGFITPGSDATNIDQVAIEGLTLAWEGRWRTGSFSVSADHLTPRDLSGQRTLVRHARNDLKAVVDWDFGAWTAGGTWATYSSRPDITGYDDSFDPVYGRLGGYTTVDLRADWKLAPAWTLGVRVNNVADARYETAYGYDQPGRQAFVVLSWQSR